MITTRVLASCAIVLACHTVASAKTIRTFKVAAWKGGAYSNNATNAFSHCAASARYKSGITVYFSINRKFEWSMAFSKPEWQLERGAVYDIAFKVDSTPPIGAKARAIQPTLVQVPLRDSATLFRRFQNGERLYVATAGKKFAFNLTDSSKILNALLGCVRHYVKEAPPAESNPFASPPTPEANPFASPPKMAATNPESAPAGNASASRLEATTIAANLMAVSGIKGFRLLPPEQAAKIRVDAAWIAGGTVGTIRIVPSDKVASLKDISGRLIGGNAKNCKGTFASGAIPEPGNDAVVRVFTACKVGDQANTIYYLAMHRKQGGYYLFSTAAKGSEQPAKEADAMIRQAVERAIPR